MSCQLQKQEQLVQNYLAIHNYILLFLDNLETANYKKISGDLLFKIVLHDY